jgi:hypothetical protein
LGEIRAKEIPKVYFYEVENRKSTEVTQIDSLKNSTAFCQLLTKNCQLIPLPYLAIAIFPLFGYVATCLLAIK